VAVCELKKGPLVYALMKYQHIAIVPVHSATFARYRKAFQPSGAKGDPSDARIVPNRLMVEAISAQLKVHMQAIETMDQEIKTRYAKMTDRVIFDS
jgi:hypothetical protein